MHVVTGAEPYAAPARETGHGVGVLVSHGFAGTPGSVRPWAEHLAGQGYAVRLPRLPGHGTTWQDCNRTRWQDWLACLETELHALWQECDQVFVAGSSLGGALVARLAELHGPRVAGLVLVDPSLRSADARVRALPVLRHLVPSLPGDLRLPGAHEVAYDRTPLHALASVTELWRLTVRDLPEITQPVLVLQSDEDRSAPASGTELLLSRISSSDVTRVRLPGGCDVAPLDHDASVVLDASVAFVERVSRGVAS